MQSASPLSARRDESLKSFQNINHAEVDSSDKRKLKSLFRLLPFNRCMARFDVVSGAGELGFPLLSHLENRVVTL